MKMYKVKDQEEAVTNAKLFYETVKLAWGLKLLIVIMIEYI